VNKEIKILNYVFKYKEKINLISIEEYYNYQNENAKIKLIIDNEFYEKESYALDDYGNCPDIVASYFESKEEMFESFYYAVGH
jgi:hypothetical protein